MRAVLYQLFEATPILVAAILNALAFLVGYSVLRPLRTLNLFLFAFYIVLMAALNYVFYNAHWWEWSRFYILNFGWVFEFLLVFAVAIIANIACFQYLFRLKGPTDIRVAVLVGFTVAQSFIVGFPLFK